MERLTVLHIEADLGHGYEGRKKFKQAVYKAWKKNPFGRKTILLLAANEISMGRSGATVAMEMERLRKYCRRRSRAATRRRRRASTRWLRRASTWRWRRASTQRRKKGIDSEAENDIDSEEEKGIDSEAEKCID